MDGCDCWGLACVIYLKELGITLPDYLECYKSTADKDVLKKLIHDERQSKWQHPDKGQPFDLIWLKMGGVAFHVGVVTKSGYMIHCARDVGTVIESYTSLKWQNKVMGFGRYAE